jgi:hypothetical protein
MFEKRSIQNPIKSIFGIGRGRVKGGFESVG